MKRSPFVAVGVAALAATLVLVGAGAAVAVEGPGTPNQADTGAEIEIVSVESGRNVQGNIGDIPDGTTYPVGTATGVSEYAALIVVRDVSSGLQSKAYCVDLTTTTYIGTRYSAEDWPESDVPNSTYIEYILTHYFPYVPDSPAGSDTDRVAAVQSAIWYFSDGWVLTSGESARPDTAAIVADALANGGATPPPVAPSLGLSPESLSAPSDAAIAGPFTVTGTALGATVQGTAGLDLFLDAAHTQPAPAGTPLSEGSSLWAGNIAQLVPPASFTIGAQYTVPVGTLYLADPDPNGYQKIVLAQTDTLPVRAHATVSLFAANAVTVVKTIGGTAAGRQSAISLQVTCTPQPQPGTATSFTIPAGSAAGSYTFSVTGVPVGATCSVAETANGASPTATLTSTSITPASVTVPAAGDVPPIVTVVDQYATPATPILPVTGAEDRATTALAGGGMLLVGLALVIVRRRMLVRR